MVDYDLVKKAKELFEKADRFDKDWLSSKGIFRLLNKAGAISDEDLQEITTEYDRMMAPVTKAQEEAKEYVTDKAMRILWNYGFVDKEPGKKN